MGCSSSTQTAGQEGRRPSTKTDESNGAGVVGNYNETSNIPEDEDIVGSSAPDDDLLQASSEEPQVQPTDSPETQAELPGEPTSVETLAQASGEPQPPEGDAVDASASVEQEAPAECAAADQGDVMEPPSQEIQSPAAEGGETEEVVAKETGSDGATEVANTGEAAAASEE